MKHLATARFWSCYNSLPSNLKRLADSNYALLKLDERHPSLHFKKIGRFRSVRVGLHHRALAVESGDDLVWFWIGHHGEYDRLVGRQAR